MIRSRCVPLLLALAGCAVGRPRPAPLYVGWGGSLPSGLRLVVYSQDGARGFRLAASYTGGSAADPEGRERMALLAARLASRARPAGGALQERTAAAGSRDGFEVTRMDLAFVQEGRAAALRAALEVERDRLADPLAGITEEEFLEAREALAVERGLAYESGGPDLTSRPWPPRCSRETPRRAPRGRPSRCGPSRSASFARGPAASSPCGGWCWWSRARRTWRSW